MGVKWVGCQGLIAFSSVILSVCAHNLLNSGLESLLPGVLTPTPISGSIAYGFRKSGGGTAAKPRSGATGG